MNINFIITILPLYRLRGFFFKVEVVELPEENELTVAQVTLCNIFKNSYLQKCKDDIVSDKR